MITKCLAAAIANAGESARESGRLLGLLEIAGDGWIINNQQIATRLIQDCLSPRAKAILDLDAVFIKCLEQTSGGQLATKNETCGPGTELSKLLKRFGIEPTPTCACRSKAAEMDAWGCDECEKPERIAEVVAVMRAEAEARGLPFLDVAGRLLVRRAIANARRNA